MSGRATTYPWRTALLVAIVTSLGTVLLGAFLPHRADRPSSGATAAAAAGADRSPRHRTPPSTPSPTPSSTPRPDLSPVRLEIPAIDVATPLVRLGLMPDRTVEVPGDPDRAGWFHPGSLPGQRGSAVILGHVDSVQGPAVFARLQELRPGDVVTVDRADGSAVWFVVVRAELYANRDFPDRRVYADRHGHLLNLVTCGGSYDSTRGGYQSNLVVYTRRAPGARAAPG